MLRNSRFGALCARSRPVLSRSITVGVGKNAKNACLQTKSALRIFDVKSQPRFFSAISRSPAHPNASVRSALSDSEVRNSSSFVLPAFLRVEHCNVRNLLFFFLLP